MNCEYSYLQGNSSLVTCLNSMYVELMGSLDKHPGHNVPQCIGQECTKHALASDWTEAFRFMVALLI